MRFGFDTRLPHSVAMSFEAPSFSTSFHTVMLRERINFQTIRDPRHMRSRPGEWQQSASLCLYIVSSLLFFFFWLEQGLKSHLISFEISIRCCCAGCHSLTHDNDSTERGRSACSSSISHVYVLLLSLSLAFQFSSFEIKKINKRVSKES